MNRIRVDLHDSSSFWSNNDDNNALATNPTSIDAVIANLPWGVNSVIRTTGENEEESDTELSSETDKQELYREILTNTRQLIAQCNNGGKEVGVPCAFVFPPSTCNIHERQENDNRQDSDSMLQELVQSCGYEIMGMAHIPPRDFQLPSSRKKPKKSSNKKSAKSQGTTSDCIVVIAKTVHEKS
eukprot:CAMPEP_0172460382 /NCGR_PEP_ID=MMETSP1065-20121228/36698_1 /TAXON_ID=265537 /ORGANISM="Amphiprora paludosa, Strain CCMP125" /LENGTH=183 /DNA_ID=CAMNT_0013215389 /DNA_START=42 /DNA_END=596 /DNA_ORIENTATION=+